MHETGRVNTTYETFRRHVRRYIDERKRAAAVGESTPAGAAVKKESQQAGPSPKKENVIPERTPVKESRLRIPAVSCQLLILILEKEGD
nr:hypothetical protein [Salmonella enterica]